MSSPTPAALQVFDDVWTACTAWATDLVRWHREHHPEDWTDTPAEREPLVRAMVAAALGDVAHAEGHDAPDGACLYRVPLTPVLDRLAEELPGPQQEMLDRAASMAAAPDSTLEELQAMQNGADAILVRWQIAGLARDIAARHLDRALGALLPAEGAPAELLKYILNQHTTGAVQPRLGDRVTALLPADQARTLLAVWRVADRPARHARDDGTSEGTRS
ncbi:hypothetical protein [Streptomyces sp. MP131-18]|uniref:hypothetical protein n=1 Tax=Streptomyces sp. MP131-18 TaxID=1857892 RepID=UPI0009C6CE85|nr:hypothetical protein [Streptomyces sp. MP131-18]ONK13188.1 hypothetical protein STBA_39510 [Streptomyces sp. MP131-18]